MKSRITKKDIKNFFILSASLLIIFIVVLNFFNIKASFFNIIGNHFYEKNTQNALKNYLKALENVSDENLKNAIKYNIGNLFYKDNVFSGALNMYEKIQTKDKELNFRINHNIGNSYYRLGEKEESDKNKFLIWTKSLKAYEKALELKKDLETQKNYNFVKDKLEKLRDQIIKNTQKNPQKQPMPGGQKGDQDNKNQDKKDEELKDNNNQNTGTGENQGGNDESQNKNFGKTMTNSGSFNNIGKDTGSGKLSEKDKETLEQYTKELNNLQKDYQKYLNRNGDNNQGTSQTGIINEFFGNGDDNGDKDW